MAYYDHYSKVPASEWKWPDFSPQEIACRGTGKLLIDTEAMDKLQALRTELGKPLIVNSAYRSPEHNRAVGGASQSQHLQGKAFDVSMANHNPTQFEVAAKRHGFRGIGHYVTLNFMHIDTGSTRKWNGSDGKWFPQNNPTPDFHPEPRPDRIQDTLLKPEVLAPAGGLLSGATGLAQGNGPVQWAFGIAMIALVGFGIFMFIRSRTSQQKLRD